MLISVVMPVHNGRDNVRRAIASVVAQRWSDWELLAVDDGSTDDSLAPLRQAAEADGRIRVMRTEFNSGPAAARNVGLRAASGSWVAYLDCDDEYYPDYLATIARLAENSDVLVFGYDYCFEEGPQRDRVFSWDPTPFRGFMFSHNLSVPLGIAHRRDLVEQVGGFDESLWCQEDWEFWKRLARDGADFLFVPFRAGLYRLRRASRSHAPRATSHQSRMYQANRDVGRPLYTGAQHQGREPRVERVVFASPYCLIDGSSGAAVATQDLLEMLSQSGFLCQAYCGAKLDFGEEAPLETVLAAAGLPYDAKRMRIPTPRAFSTSDSGGLTAKLVFTKRGKVPITVFRNQFSRPELWGVGMSTISAIHSAETQAGTLEKVTTAGLSAPSESSQGIDPGSVKMTANNSASGHDSGIASTGPTVGEEIPAFLAAFEAFLAKTEPDVVLTYGGGPVGDALISLAKRRDVPVVFLLHNFAYHNAATFRNVDYVVVPSVFAKQWYWERLRLHCHVLPYAIDWQRVEVRGRRLESVSCRPKAEVVRSALDSSIPTACSVQPTDYSLPPEASSPTPSTYVTFVNPQPAKGLVVFARIAEQLARRRPDIPLLVVEGRARAASSLSGLGLDLSFASNLYYIQNSPDPRQFYTVTKILLMPSLWNESFGLVAAEAMINGIPVLAANRGALPETLGAPKRATTDASASFSSAAYGLQPTASSCPGGFLFDIPARYTPETADVPTADEVLPWVETIIRLWDDDGFYRDASQRAIAHAQRWRPERLRPVYADFFRTITRQPGPPIVPKPA